jgi:hypothetical protein
MEMLNDHGKDWGKSFSFYGIAIGHCIIIIHRGGSQTRFLRRHRKRHQGRGGWTKVDGTGEEEGIFIFFME